MRKLSFQGLTARVILVLIGLIVTLSISEIILRVVDLNSRKTLGKRNFKKITYHSTETMPGISGEKQFSLNSKGFRGDEFSKEHKYHLLALGGSTTVCIYLDDQNAWPYLTQMIINEKGFQVWLGNAGVNGARIENHVSDFNYIIKKFPFIDAVIVMVGINDLWESLMLTLEQPEKKNGNEMKDLIVSYKKTALWKLGRNVKNRLFFRKRQQERAKREPGASYIGWRMNRMSAEKHDTMPNLSEKLSVYRSNLNNFVDAAMQRNVRVIFMTQPTMWRSDLSVEEDKLIWFGWGGEYQWDSTKYYTVDVLTRVMAQFNNVLLEVCDNRGVECIDLATVLEKDTTTFYDDCHFNTSGSRKVAEILSKYLLVDAPVDLPEQ